MCILVECFNFECLQNSCNRKIYALLSISFRFTGNGISMFWRQLMRYDMH